MLILLYREETMLSQESNPYGPPRPFERFSEDIRHVLRLANREAKWRFAATIDTPHLMTGIVREPTGLGGGLLRNYGVTEKLVRQESRDLAPGIEYVTLFGKIPLSANTEHVIADATERALIEKHDSVGTGGVLLSMLQIDQKTVTILARIGVDVSELEKALMRYLQIFMVDRPGEALNFDSISSRK